jgi:hypothetical protein
MQKEHLILGVLIIALMLVGICALIIRSYESAEPPSFGEKLLFEHQLDFARVLRDGMPNNLWQTSIDEKRNREAVEILSNGKLDESVVFLHIAVTIHSVYGYMAQMIFVDESANVSEVAYQAPGKDPDNPGERVMFLPGERIYAQQRMKGWVWSEVILGPSDDITEGTVSDANAYEPDYLFLPKEAHKSLIAGAGEMLLLDENGNVLDSLAITITNFKRSGQTEAGKRR